MFNRGAFILLVFIAIAQVAVGLEISQVANAIAESLAPLFAFSTAEKNVEVAIDVDTTIVPESKEPVACNDPDGGEVNATSTEDVSKPTTFEVKRAANGDRIISSEELALHTTKKRRIWLSILGKVYDVTDGQKFYSTKLGGDYTFYAGRDASPCFGTGNNTPEGAEEKIEEWGDNKKYKLLKMWEWSEFYPQHDTYTFIGVLGGSRYYDEEGNETQVRKDIVHNAEEALRIQKEEWESSAEKRREEFEEKKKRRAENKRKYEERKKKQAAQAAAKTQ